MLKLLWQEAKKEEEELALKQGQTLTSEPQLPGQVDTFLDVPIDKEGKNIYWSRLVREIHGQTVEPPQLPVEQEENRQREIYATKQMAIYWKQFIGEIQVNNVAIAYSILQKEIRPEHLQQAMQFYNEYEKNTSKQSPADALHHALQRLFTIHTAEEILKRKKDIEEVK